jgi:hypothetical protein
MDMAGISPSSRAPALKQKAPKVPTKKKDDAYEITDGDPTHEIEIEERMEYKRQMEANIMMYSDASTDHRVRDEQFFLNMDVLMRKVKQIASKNGLSTGFGEGVCETLSLAVQEHIRTILDKLVRMSIVKLHLLKFFIKIAISKLRLDLNSETMEYV